ncbi:hypothetical protein Droror1_Dr00024457 [Drosera rotundifolia]
MPNWRVEPRLSFTLDLFQETVCVSMNVLTSSFIVPQCHCIIIASSLYRPTDTEARIVKIRNNGFIVFVPKYGIEGPVFLTPRGEKGVGEWVVDEQDQKVRKTDGSISYSVLQIVRIHLEVVEPQPNWLKLELTLI